MINPKRRQINAGDRVRVLDDGPLHGMVLPVLKTYKGGMGLIVAVHFTDLNEDQRKESLVLDWKTSADGFFHYALYEGQYEQVGTTTFSFGD